MKHSKEPWIAVDRKDNRGNVVGWAVWQDLDRPYSNSPRGERIAITPDGSTSKNEENAKRIVACVNACKGVTTEVLEAGIIDWALARAIPSDGIRESTKWEDVKVWEAEG